MRLLITAGVVICCAGVVFGQADDPAVPAPSSTAIRQAAKASAEDCLAAAESLLQLARNGKLDDDAAQQAADLLAHDDPFVRGIAEWAIATRVQRDNRGQEVVWPQADPPAWFAAWSQLDGPTLVDCDYVRQAFVWSIHRNPAGLLGSMDKILNRARGAAGEIRRHGGAAQVVALAERHLHELEELRARLAGELGGQNADLATCRSLWLAARRAAREIVLANPVLDFEQLVTIRRHPGSFANITGSQYPWGHKPGGGIFVQRGWSPGSDVRDVLQDQLGLGHVHGMDLWWDADRVVFGYARQPDWPPPWDTISGDNVFRLRSDQQPTHVFEIGLDGSGLRQVTDHPYWSDFEPTYLPDGGIVFSSDRSGRSSECGKFSADHTVINLYAVDADGRNVRQLSDNKDIDRYPHTLDNGLIAYTRWEYQERHFLEVHALWTIRPDGTMADALFNQHLRAPYGLRDTRSIPGSSQLVSIATGHHTFAYGPVVAIDPQVGINDPAAIRIITPRVAPQEGPMAGTPVAEGGPPDHGGVYQTPWALSENTFLVSYSYSDDKLADGFAVYLIDVHGNKELVARDLVYSCAFPMPVRRRPRPPQVAPLVQRQEQAATCYVTDITHGMDGVAPGTVRYVRISQRVGWPLDDQVGAMRYIPGNAWEKHFGYWAWAPVRVIGVVPVREDGSVQFTVPSGQSVYFQALDEHFMEVRRMRSHISFEAGEVRGCVGCHETGAKTPLVSSRPAAALVEPPLEPAPPAWGADQLLGYEWLGQPILDQHCTRCHGSEQPDDGLDLSGTLAADGFLQSFRTMFGIAPGASTDKGRMGQHPLVSVSDRFSGASVSKPFEFGSHRSPLIRVLRDDPLHRQEVNMPDDQWRALVTWVDANAPYHDRFFNRRPKDGESPRRDIDVRFTAR
jgi:hypothetical protein